MYFHGKYDEYRQPSRLDEALEMYGQDAYGIALPTNNVEDKEQWIDALLSGNYQQATNKLCIIDREGKKKHCCLGVYAEIKGINAMRAHEAQYFQLFSFPVRDDNGIMYYKEGGLLQGTWAKEHGFYDRSGTFGFTFKLFGTEFFSTYSLSELNDNGFSFTQIADVIRHFF